MAKGSLPFYVSFGEESLLLDRDLARGRAFPGRDIVSIDGAGLTDVEFVNVLETSSVDPFDPQEPLPRCVVVDNAGKIKGDKALKAYIKDKSPQDDSVVVVAVVRSEKLPAVWLDAVKKGKATERKKLKTYDTNNEVLGWIRDEGSRLGIIIDEKMSLIVYERIGSDLYRLANEIQKLSLLVERGKSVTIDHLRQTLSFTATAEPYQVADFMAAKDAKRAMAALSLLYRNGHDDPAVPVVYALMKVVEKLMTARSMLDRSASEDDVAARLSMHPWRCKTYFIPQARRHTTRDLKGAMALLCDLDIQMKTTGPKRTLLELAILSIAR